MSMARKINEFRSHKLIVFVFLYHAALKVKGKEEKMFKRFRSGYF